MSLDLDTESAAPIAAPGELEAWFRAAGRPPSQWRLGLEHEKIALLADTLEPVPYFGRRGIRALLARARKLGYRRLFERADPVAAERSGQWISLEPGGQVELSGRPASSAAELAREHLRHCGRLKALGAELGLAFLLVGYRPFGGTEQMPWVPKRRYALLRDALQARGRLALDMMLMTASVQVSVDYADEEDCSRKARAAAAMASLLVALYANSPIAQGRRSGYQSFRSRVWWEVDSDRSGLLPFLLDEEGLRFRRYVSWALKVPMVFIRRRGRYLRVRGYTFERFLREGYQGERATWRDWADHLTLLFPEVRLKRVLEIRSPDACDVATSNALPALCRGVLYDPQAREEVVSLTAGLSFTDRLLLHARVARDALRARVPGSGRPVQELCAELVAIGAQGLRRQKAEEDLPLLAPLEEIATSGRTRADALLDAFAQGNPRRLAAACALDANAFERHRPQRIPLPLPEAGPALAGP